MHRSGARARRKRPCLQYQIRRCLAPCVYEVDPAWYRDQVRRGRATSSTAATTSSSRELETRMKGAARDCDFELAATYRDQLRAIDDDPPRAARRHRQRRRSRRPAASIARAISSRSRCSSSERASHRHRAPSGARRRAPRRRSRRRVRSRSFTDEGRADALTDPGPRSSFRQPPTAPKGVAEWLSDRRGKRCDVLAPQRGPRVDLLRLANDNAEHAFREQRRAADDVEERLAQLQKRLRLPTLPRRIECCDISHLGGQRHRGSDRRADQTACPTKSGTAPSAVRTVTGGDDYGAMYEVLARRFRRGRAAEQAKAGDSESEAEAEGTRESIDWDLPDLFVVDGGRGQLNVALTAARDLGLHELPIVALAKENAIPGVSGHRRGRRRHQRPERAPRRSGGLGTEGTEVLAARQTPPRILHTMALLVPSPSVFAPRPSRRSKKARAGRRRKKPDDLVDRVYLPGQKNGIPLLSNSTPLFFLARARDEAHRFSNRARERIGKARRFRSDLDDIAGIGPVTRRSLLKTLGSVDGVRQATDECCSRSLA